MAQTNRIVSLLRQARTEGGAAAVVAADALEELGYGRERAVAATAPYHRLAAVTVAVTQTGAANDHVDHGPEGDRNFGWADYTLTILVDGGEVGMVEGWHACGDLDSGVRQAEDGDESGWGIPRARRFSGIVSIGDGAHRGNGIRMPTHATDGMPYRYDTDEIDRALQRAADEARAAIEWPHVPEPITADETHLAVIAARSYNDTAREMAREGVMLTHEQYDEIGELGHDWLTRRLNLVRSTSDRGHLYSVAR